MKIQIMNQVRKIKPIKFFRESVVFFDDMWRACNSSLIDEFYTRGKYEKKLFFTLVRAILVYPE